MVNGHHAFTVETSKTLQLSLLEELKLSYPRSLVINHPSQALPAAQGLRYPVVVKANIGGSARESASSTVRRNWSTPCC